VIGSYWYTWRVMRGHVVVRVQSMQVRASAWRALAQVLAVAPRILQFPSAQTALSSALSDKEKSATVRPTGRPAAPR